MRSPVDRHSTLERRNPFDGLEAWRCPSSGGWWVDGDAYWHWLRSRLQMPLGIVPPSKVEVEVVDSDQALISPRSGRLMQKFSVGGSLRFRIDFDKVSGGFWLDAGEIEVLDDQELADRLHLICDAEYQRLLRDLDTAASRAERLDHLLGAEGKERIESLAGWLDQHKHRELGIAYLMELLDQD